jgi:hypothetical protein
LVRENRSARTYELFFQLATIFIAASGRHRSACGSERWFEAPIPADPKRFRISFLPMESAVQRNGLQLFDLRYRSDARPDLVRNEEPLLVRYDPRDLSESHV